MMNVKKILPLEVNYEIKNFWRYFITKNLAYKELCNRVFFLDAADYNNCGDLAIAEAIKLFFECYFTDRDLYIIRQKQLLHYFKNLKREIKSTDLIVLSGGGNMGTAYPGFEAIRRKVIRNFPNNQIVIFPCTIDYPNDRYGRLSLSNAIRTYSSHNKLLLYAREKKTYDYFLKNFSNNTVLRGPDIVFFLKRFARNVSVNSIRKDKVGVCLRRDNESKLSNSAKNDILSYLEINNINYTMFTTMCSTEDFCYNYKEIVERKLREIAEYSLVITDRLHATIFSYLVGTPCIAYDNVNGKVFGVCKEIENINVIFAEPEGSLEEYISQAFTLKNLTDTNDLDEQFNRMSIEIRNVL